MTIYAYHRVSELEASLGQEKLETILQSELLAIQTYCLAKNWLLNETLDDVACHWGLKFQQREKGAQLTEMLRFGDKIICSKLERIVSSSAEVLELINSFRNRGVQLHIVELGGNIVGKEFVINFKNAAELFSTLDKRKSAERIKAVKRRQRNQGRYLGGSRPFGYMIHDNGRLIENPMEQRLLKKIIELKRQGKSLRAISNEISTPVLPISFKTVQRLLQRHADQL